MNKGTLELIDILAEATGSNWCGKSVKMAESKTEARRLIENGAVFYETDFVNRESKPWDEWKSIDTAPAFNGVIRIGKGVKTLRFLRIDNGFTLKDISDDESDGVKIIATTKKKRLWQYLKKT